MSASQFMDSAMSQSVIDPVSDVRAISRRRQSVFLKTLKTPIFFISDIVALGIVIAPVASVIAPRQLWGAVLIFGVIAAHLAARGHYTQRMPFWTMARDIVPIAALGVVCDLVLTTQITGTAFGPAEALRWPVFVILLLALRMACVALLQRAGAWKLRTLVIGPSRDRARVMDALRSDPTIGLHVAGDLNRKSFLEIHGTVPRGIDHVVLVADPYDPEADAGIAHALQHAGVPLSLVPVVSMLPVQTGQAHYFLSHSVVLMSAGHVIGRPLAKAAKRVFDLLAAASLLVVISPVMLAIALLVRRDGGPMFFRHERVGVGGTSFGCLKFRSMKANGDRILAEHLAHHPEAVVEWEASQKLRCDPRVTDIGRILRKTSLDELPQLFNVLRGEMSLVGPRPIVRAELRFYGEHGASYMQVKPGVTGLWQVSGRSDTSYERRVNLDVWYVRNWTFWHDLAILMKTVPVVLLRRGAV